MATFPEHFERQYQLHLKHLKLKGLQPKTIDACARECGGSASARLDDLKCLLPTRHDLGGQLLVLRCEAPSVCIRPAMAP
jgi:hypothetical protein